VIPPPADPAGLPAAAEPSVEQAIRALSEGESDLSRARRVARMVVDAGLPDDSRVELLNRLMRIEPRVARQVSLQLGSTAPRALRQAAGGVLSVTSGSEDDLPALLSLAAHEEDQEIRRSLELAVEGLRSPSITDAVAVFAKLVGRDADAARLDPDRLVPRREDRYLFARWVHKTWSRAAAADPARYVAAVLALCDVMIDQLVLALGPQPGVVEAAEIDRIRHRLTGRPTTRELVDRAVLRARHPWLARVAQLHRTGDADAVAAAFGVIGTAWIQDMYEATRNARG